VPGTGARTLRGEKMKLHENYAKVARQSEKDKQIHEERAEDLVDYFEEGYPHKRLQEEALNCEWEEEFDETTDESTSEESL
jgi:hypothetical protein